MKAWASSPLAKVSSECNSQSFADVKITKDDDLAAGVCGRHSFSVCKKFFFDNLRFIVIKGEVNGTNILIKRTEPSF